MIYDPHRSTIFDLDANLVAGFCYLITLLPLGWLSLVGLIVVFFVEKQSDFVKFHAAQSFSISCLLFIFSRVVLLIFSFASITTPFAVVFFVEKQSDFVKFHAAQSFSISCLLFIFSRVVLLIFSFASITTPFAVLDFISMLTFGSLGSVFGLLLILVSLIIFCLRVYLMVQAFRYRESFIPLFGHFADFLCRKLNP